VSACVFERTSPLAVQLAQPGRDGLQNHRTVTLSEVRGWHLAQVGFFAGQEAKVSAALRLLLGGDVLVPAGKVARLGERSIYRCAPDACWIAGPDAGLEAELARCVPPHAGTVIPLTHSRVRIGIAGSSAASVLNRGIAVDLHPGAFAVGAFAQTGLHHAGVLLERSGAERFELWVLRTFAATIWDWLTDAALPCGYEVATEQATMI
jgi:methylglutamate dehydrogenase subunit D